MSLKARTSKGKCKAKIEGDMTIYTAGEIKDKLLQKLAGCEAMELDLSQVTELDTSGFQVLALLKREAELREKELQLKGHGHIVQDVFALFHVTDQLIAAYAEPEQTSPDRV